jgi:hypothetical protein
MAERGERRSEGGDQRYGTQTAPRLADRLRIANAEYAMAKPRAPGAGRQDEILKT